MVGTNTVVRFQSTCKLCGKASLYVAREIELAEFISNHAKTAHPETVQCLIAGNGETIEAYYKDEKVEMRPLPTARA